MERIGMDCMILSIGENVTTYDACHEDVWIVQVNTSYRRRNSQLYIVNILNFSRSPEKSWDLLFLFSPINLLDSKSESKGGNLRSADKILV